MSNSCINFQKNKEVKCMLYFVKPPVQVFMAEVAENASGDMEGRCRRKRRKKGKRPYTMASYFLKRFSQTKNQK